MNSCLLRPAVPLVRGVPIFFSLCARPTFGFVDSVLFASPRHGRLPPVPLSLPRGLRLVCFPYFLTGEGDVSRNRFLPFLPPEYVNLGPGRSLRAELSLQAACLEPLRSHKPRLQITF